MTTNRHERRKQAAIARVESRRAQREPSIHAQLRALDGLPDHHPVEIELDGQRTVVRLDTARALADYPPAGDKG